MWSDKLIPLSLILGAALAGSATHAAGPDRFMNGQSFYGQPADAQADARVVDVANRGYVNAAYGETLRFVSTYSLDEAARGLPRIIEMQVIPGDRGEGVRLIVNEHIYAGPLSTGQFCLGPVPDPRTGASRMGFAPVESSRRSFVLADRLASCHFLYRRALPQPPFEEWLDEWTPFPSPLPSAIRVEMQPLAGASGRLRHSPVTVPLHFLRDFGERYEDK